jgi:thiol:disulfide interchange protein DsbD
MIRPFIVPAILILVLLAAPAVLAADPPVRVTAVVQPDTATPGARVTVFVTAKIEEGYHVYGVPPVPEAVYPTRVVVLGPEGYAAEGDTLGPAPLSKRDESLGEVVPQYEGTVVFTLTVAVPGNAVPGPVTLRVGLDHMACTESFCLDPATVESTVLLRIAGEPVPLVSAPPVDPDTYHDRTPEGFGGLLIAAFIGGLLSILLPCVYPLIPLTLAFFAKKEEGRRAAVRRALLFCFGIVLTFTALGVVLGPALQALAASLWLNLFLFLLMLVLAFSLLGWFDIRLPSSLTDKAQAAGAGASLAAPVFMGLAFSLASFTCTVGVIGPILAASASEWVRSAAGMFAYSAGFALPFFVLALFPSLLSSLPKGGGWLNTVKVLLGFFELAFAGYYLWRVDVELGWGIGSWSIILSLWTVTVFFAGLYLLGKLLLPHDRPVERVSVVRVTGALLLFAFGLTLGGGLFGLVPLPGWVEGLLPPREALAAGASADTAAAVPRPEWADETFHPGYGGVFWTTDYERGLAIGRRTGRRVFLNFTGIYCSNCRTMEKSVFPREEVRGELAEMVLVELWTDIPSDEAGRKFGVHTTAEQSRKYRDLRSAAPPDGFGTAANPWYVIVAPDGRRLARSGYEADVSAFVRFLRTGK